MANLIRKRGASPVPRLFRDMDWDDFFTPRTLQREIDRLFDDFLGAGAENGERARRFVPQLEVKETDKEYLLSAELPGIAEADLKVEIDDNRVLTIRGEKKSVTEETRGGTAYSERSYGEFLRSVQLPNGADADKAQASFANGVLEIHIPKGEQARARAVPIGKGTKEEPKKMEGAAAERVVPKQA